MDKILLACFDFPPNEGIGGRRWAKFAKSLAEKGIVVHVIKADPVATGSGWQKDVEHPNIKIHSIARSYPKSISHPSGSILGKIKYRLALKKLQLDCKGTIYDIANGFEDVFKEKALQIIDSHKIKHLAVTGAPFNLIYYAARMKEFREFKLLVDYRDPWITAQNYGMTNLDSNRMVEEKRKQDYVFENADIITCPNEFLLKEIKESSDKSELPKARFEVLPHFFDQDDIKACTQPRKAAEDVRIVYGGALYLGLKPFIDPFSSWLSTLREKESHYYNKLTIDLFTPHSSHVGSLENHANVHPPIGKDFMNELAQSSAAIILLAEHNKDFLTTKFFELIPFGKPLIFIGAQGAAAQFIEKNGLGKIVDSYESLAQVIKELQSDSFPINRKYDISSHELSHVGDHLISLIK